MPMRGGNKPPLSRPSRERIRYQSTWIRVQLDGKQVERVVEASAIQDLDRVPVG